MAKVIYNCKRCKIGRTVEYPFAHKYGFDGRLTQWYRLADGRKVFPGAHVVAVGGGKPTQYGGDVEMGLCSQCHKVMTFGQLKATLDLTHKCDARCEGARGHDCECSCGGENHGKAWAA